MEGGGDFLARAVAFQLLGKKLRVDGVTVHASAAQPPAVGRGC